MLKFWLRSPLFDEKQDSPEGSGDKKQESNVNDKYKDIDLDSAATLYRALNDPELSRDVVEQLAKNAGILDKIEPKKGETKAEAKSRAEGILSKKLGKEYGKFAEIMGPALDEIVEDYVNDLVDEKFGQINVQRNTDAWSNQVDKFMGTVELTPEVEEQMMEFMQDSPPNTGRKGFDPQKYLSRIYKNACEELNIQPTKKSRNSRSKDIEDIEDLPNIVVKDRPKSLSISEAVDAAVKGIRFRR